MIKKIETYAKVLFAENKIEIIEFETDVVKNTFSISKEDMPETIKKEENEFVSTDEFGDF